MRATTFAVIAAICCLLTACASSDGGGDGQSCTPGESVLCYCAGAARGAQRCLLDGAGFTPCECEADDRDAIDDPDPDGPCRGRLCEDVGDLRSIDTHEDDAGENDTSDTESDPRTEDSAVADQATDSAEEPVVVDSGADGEGRDVAAGSRRLGDDCDRAADCETDICFGLNMGAGFHSICVEPCCDERACPIGFGCLQAGAGRYCLPSRIFPAGYTFTGETGESCGVGNDACKSGICEISNDMCRGTCCGDADCNAAPCSWSVTGAGTSNRTFCDPLALLGDPDGSGCIDGRACRSGVCAEVSPGVGQCAGLCCTSGDCPTGTGCGLVAGLGDSVTRACVPLERGATRDGEPCADDGESCASGHCIEGACRRLCCLDGNCVGGERCLPRNSNEGVMVPVCVMPGE